MDVLIIIGVVAVIGFAIGAFIINNEEKKYGRRD